MIITRPGKALPDWCEVRRFDLIEASAFSDVTFEALGPNDVIVVTYGTGKITLSDRVMVIRDSQYLVLPPGERKITLSGTSRPVQVIHFSGHWGADIYGCGTFPVSLEVRSQFVGDKVSYPKATSFDSHYHDYDEYWVIVQGSGTVVVAEHRYFVRPGDCVPIGAGYHHDFPLVDAPVKAAYLEVSACGQKRLGHLWNHTHGPAKLVAARAPTI